MLDLKKLKDYKTSILKAEIGALLFNMGKTHAGIGNWKNYFPGTAGEFNDYRDYYSEGFFLNELASISPELKDFFSNLEVTLPSENLNDAKIKLLNLMKGKGLIRKIFFNGCENINSGIDKGSPIVHLKDKLFVANAFGTLKNEISADDLDKERECFLKRLHIFMVKNRYYINPDWEAIRNWFIEKIKPWYSSILSDNRLPVNDVTLWDQVYMTAAMFKAVLANMVLAMKAKQEKIKDYYKYPTKIKWRILGIQYDKLSLAERGFKPAQIEWYRETARKIDEQIKALIEIDYSLGNEVYRDETGIYFLVGEDLGTDDNCQLTQLHPDLTDLKKDILEIFNNGAESNEENEAKGEFYPAIFLTKPSRRTMNLTSLLEKADNNFLKAYNPHKSFLLKDGDSSICPVCQMRAFSASATMDKNEEDEYICEQCKETKTKGRRNKWLNKITDETIWTTELQDKNGRIALVTMKFELKEWMNGSLLNSLLTNKVDYCECLDKIKTVLGQALCGKDTVDGWKNNFEDLATESAERFRAIDDCHNWIGQMLLGSIIGTAWESIIKNTGSGKCINWDEQSIIWNACSEEDIDFFAELLLQFLLRKNPTPARLRRVWETTEDFFKGIEKDNGICNLAKIPEQRCTRLSWKNSKKISNGEYQDGELLFWVTEKEIYLISPEPKDKNEFVLKPYNKNTKEVTTLSKDDAIRLSYKPYFSIIYPTPVSWQFAMPAEYIPNLLKEIKRQYNDNFKWVYGKLPLHIGIVIQDYKKPLYLGIKALRKIRYDNVNRKYASNKIKASVIRDIQTKCKQEEKINNTSDYYSLYETACGTGTYSIYQYPVTGGLRQIRTLSSIRDDERIIYSPNTFDFEFLDTNTRRNEIFYHKGHRSLPVKMNRPYAFEDLERLMILGEIFSSEHTASQLHNFISLLYSKYEGWNIEHDDNNIESFKIFLITLLANTFKLNASENSNLNSKINEMLGTSNVNELMDKSSDEIRWVVRLFFDSFEFWHKALKEV